MKEWVRKWLSGVDDETFTRIQFAYKQHRVLDLDPPQTFSEKLQWLKLYYRDPLIKACAHKVGVRGYVERVIGPEYLVPLHQVFNHESEFQIGAYHEGFVLKAAHASGLNKICANPSSCDEAVLRHHMAQWLATDFYAIGREWMYRDVPRQVVCEKFLDAGEGQSPWDYKLFCFHGEVKLIQVDYDRFHGHERSLYSPEWDLLACGLEYPRRLEGSARPKSLELMMALARKLSAPFPFVRVDLYEAGGRVYFGELTFCPGKGCEVFQPRKYDHIIGDFLDLGRVPEQGG